MKKIMPPIVALVISFLMLSENCLAQSKNLQKLMDNPDKLYKKTINYTGYAKAIKKHRLKKENCSASDYVIPKRVGILTFVVNDKAKTTTVHLGSYTTTSRSKVSKDGVSTFANFIYDKTIQGMKESFSSRGMKLLEIDEYLSDQEKFDLYHNYQLKKLKFVKAFDGLTNRGNSGPAQGYRNMDLAYFGAFPKAIKKRDDFFKKLDLDALIVVSIGLASLKNSFHSISSTILLKNPCVDSNAKTPYGPFSESSTVQVKVNEWEKKPTFSGLFNYEDVEYTNKRGKVKTKKKITGFDPNFYKLVNILVDLNAKMTVDYIRDSK